jgi:NAD(P)-dependent dehydrogenase (short-subunit alcohol dehydrogenase family)
MTVPHPFARQTILVVAGATGPGGQMAVHLARGGARVILADRKLDALHAIASRDPDRIEALPLQDGSDDAVCLLQEAWGHEPLNAVINLAPLSQADDISAQIALLRSLMRTTMRGLVAGQGAFITLVRRPRDPLALTAVGMCAALSEASAALGREVARQSVRVHTLTVPPKHAGRAVLPALMLASPSGRVWQSATFAID